MDNDKRVWVIQDNGHDFKPAGVYGTLEFLFKGSVEVFSSDRLKRDIIEKLAAATEYDHLVMSGPALANCIAYEFMIRKFGYVNVLIYGHKKNRYEVRTMRAAEVAAQS